MQAKTAFVFELLHIIAREKKEKHETERLWRQMQHLQ